ncbi:hypothetical protein EFR01_36130 [Sinorhizobium fredii]|nr:hypothetical protein EFR01_36130 [Sinorhizobium fredii]GLS11373.1 hypothetical protein GCM10007864_50040 [Sinorhizobium fredii]
MPPAFDLDAFSFADVADVIEFGAGNAGDADCLAVAHDGRLAAVDHCPHREFRLPGYPDLAH